jgi:Coenzyme PQQ synthesis protein D (PqqD)
MTTVTGSDVRYQRNRAVEAAPLKEASVLFNPGTNKFCLLNSTMAFIWTRVEQDATAEEIAAQICRSFSGVTPEQADSDVRQALDQMMELDLLVAHGGNA